MTVSSQDCVRVFCVKKTKKSGARRDILLELLVRGHTHTVRTRRCFFEIEDTCGTMALLLWAAGAHSGPCAALGAKLSPVCPLRHHQPAPALGAEGYSL